MTKIAIILLLWFSLWVPFAYATDRHVGSGQTYSTIQSAVNASSSGDTIYVHSGTYAELITLTANYSPSGLTITRYGTDSVTVSGNGSRVILINGASYVTISYLTLSGSADEGIIFHYGGSHDTIDHCTVTGVSGTNKFIFAGWGSAVNSFSVTNCTFSGYSPYDGPFFISSGQGFVFRHNTIDCSGLASGAGTAFFTEWLSQGGIGDYNYIEGNYFYNLSASISVSAFMFRQTGNTYFRNNVISLASSYPTGSAVAQIRGMTNGGQGCDNFYVDNNTIIVAGSSVSTTFMISDTPNNVKITNNLLLGNTTYFVEHMSPTTAGTSNVCEHNVTTDTSLTWVDSTLIGLGTWTESDNTTSLNSSNYVNLSGAVPSPYYDLKASLDGGVFAWNPTDDYDSITRNSPPDVGAFESGGGDTTPPIVTFYITPTYYNSRTLPSTQYTFIATDSSGVSGYMLNESATTPSCSDAGWQSSAPTSYVLTSDGTKTLYAWAKDGAAPCNIAYATDTVTIDTVVPTISGAYPSTVQTCTSDPRNVTIGLTTDETCTCKYDTLDRAYASMANTFAATGGTAHSQIISLACGASYIYYTRCMDPASNISGNDGTSTQISFSIVTAPSVGTVGGLGVGGLVR